MEVNIYMVYPEFLKIGDTIGITAISKGIYEEEKQKRLDNAIKYLEGKGFKVKETPNVRKCVKGRSSRGRDRAKEFMELWKDENVRAIIIAAGGDYAIEMLDYLDFEEMKKYKPKWVQGFSDVTTIGYLLPINIDIATIYADNVVNYGMRPVHKSLDEALNVMMGTTLIQYNYGKFQNGYLDYGVDDYIKPYQLDEKVCWKNLKGEEEIKISGRAIGGCLDIVTNFVGTKYDKVKDFIKKYKSEGIIWFLEVFDFTSPQVFWHLWKFKNAGYFENCNGIIFGRTATCREEYGVTFKDSLEDALLDLNIPVIYDMDFGHRPPQIAMMNGGFLEITSSNGSGYVKIINS